MHGDKRVKDLLANSNVLEIISCGESPCIKKPGYGFQIHLISENKRNGMWPGSPP